MAGGRKESALDMARFVDKGVRLKLAGGREGEGARRARGSGSAPGSRGERRPFPCARPATNCVLARLHAAAALQCPVS